MKITFRCDPALEATLPRPRPARDALPDWLRTMPARTVSEMHGTELRTVKQCPPFVDAMAFGFVMPLACDVRVAGGRLDWDWTVPALMASAHPRSPLSFHAPAQLEGSPFHASDTVAVKFNSFWTIELEPGWSLLATHPLNRSDLPFRTLSGLVDADRFHDVGILFPAVWVDRDFEGILPAGTPIAHCIPVQREVASYEFATFGTEQAEAYARTASALGAGPGHYRKQFRARRDATVELGAEPGGVEP